MLLRRAPLPPALAGALGPEEQIAARARTVDGRLLAVTRYGLWIVRDGEAERIDWHLVSKAQLSAGLLRLTVADEVAIWPGGTVLLRDRPPMDLRPERPGRLTDAVHQRVRGSVAKSHHLDWPGAGGWVVLRKVPGRDGLTAQLRLDEAANPDADGFAAAVGAVIDRLWPETVPRPHRPAPDEEGPGVVIPGE